MLNSVLKQTDCDGIKAATDFNQILQTVSQDQPCSGSKHRTAIIKFLSSVESPVSVSSLIVMYFENMQSFAHSFSAKRTPSSYQKIHFQTD